MTKLYNHIYNCDSSLVVFFKHIMLLQDEFLFDNVLVIIFHVATLLC